MGQRHNELLLLLICTKKKGKKGKGRKTWSTVNNPIISLCTATANNGSAPAAAAAAAAVPLSFQEEDRVTAYYTRRLYSDIQFGWFHLAIDSVPSRGN